MSDMTDERLAFEHGFDAGFLAGAADMRERAEKVCEDIWKHAPDDYSALYAERCSMGIRALPLTEDK